MTLIICYCIGNTENTGDDRLYFYREGVIQHPWASSMDTKLAPITLPVASSREAPIKKCHHSSSRQPLGTSPALQAGHCTGVPAWLTGHRQYRCHSGHRGKGAPLLQPGARSPSSLLRFFLPRSPPSAGSLSDVTG